MIGRETRMLLRHYLEQGASKSALARQLGLSRDTVHRWIRAGDLDRDLDTMPVRYGPRRPVPTKLDAYKAIIETRLAAYPALSAVRLLAEIRAAGFAGSYTQLKAFVRQVRPTPPAEPVIRFETPAGRQAQVDFARFAFPWGVRYARLVVLGYSRLLWCRFYLRQDMRTLIDGLEDAFRYFGGVPPELLFDQMKAVITRDLRLQGGGWCAISSFSASRTTGASRRAPVGRTVRRPRAKSSVPSVISETISSTVGPSSMTQILIDSATSGSTTSRMCECTPRRVSGHASDSIATSVCCGSRWRRVRMPHSSCRTRRGAPRGRWRRVR